MSLLRRTSFDRNQLILWLLEGLTATEESRDRIHRLLEDILTAAHLTRDQVGGDALFNNLPAFFVESVTSGDNPNALRVLSRLISALTETDESRAQFDTLVDAFLQEHKLKRTQLPDRALLESDPAAYFVPAAVPPPTESKHGLLFRLARPPFEMSPQMTEIEAKVLAFVQNLPTELSVQEARVPVEDYFNQVRTESGIVLTRAEWTWLFERVWAKAFRYDVLEELLADERVKEILVHGAKNIAVRREMYGDLLTTPLAFEDDDALLRVIDRIFEPVRVDEMQPMHSTRMNDRSVASVVLRPLSLGGPVLHIVKSSHHRLNTDDLIRFGTLTPEAMNFLSYAAKAGLSIVVAGPQGSGKTTLLQSICEALPAEGLMVDVARAHELPLEHDHAIYLQTRPANIEGKSAVTEQELVEQALLLRPDVIIVEEIRGAELVTLIESSVPFLGTMCANNLDDAQMQLVKMVQTSGTRLPESVVRTALARSLSIVVSIQQTRSGTRKVKTIAEMNADFTLTPLWEYDDLTARMSNPHFEGLLRRTSAVPRFLPRLEAVGFKPEMLDRPSAQVAGSPQLPVIYQRQLEDRIARVMLEQIPLSQLDSEDDETIAAFLSDLHARLGRVGEIATGIQAEMGLADFQLPQSPAFLEHIVHRVLYNCDSDTLFARYTAMAAELRQADRVMVYEGGIAVNPVQHKQHPATPDADEAVIRLAEYAFHAEPLPVTDSVIQRLTLLVCNRDGFRFDLAGTSRGALFSPDFGIEWQTPTGRYVLVLQLSQEMMDLSGDPYTIRCGIDAGACQEFATILTPFRRHSVAPGG